MLYKQRGSSRWWGRFTRPGQTPLRESSGTSDRQQAEEWYAHRSAELWRQRRLGERPRVAFGQAAADWIETHARHKRSFEDDRLRMRVLLSYMDVGIALEAVTTTYLATLRDRILATRRFKPKRARADHPGRPITKGGVNKYLAIIGAVLNHAHRREWLAAVPHIPAFHVDKRLPVILRPEQAQALLDALPDHLLPIAVFSLATGLRQANAARLQWSQVDLAARVVRVPPNAAKAGETITVPLPDEAVEILQGQLGKHGTHVFVYRGEPIRGGLTNTAWLRARREAGVPTLKWHHLRACWATWQAAAGIPEAIRQRWGGWKTPGMAATYTRLAASDLMPWANAMSVRLATGHSLGHSPVSAPGETAPKDTEKTSEINEMSGVADGTRTHDNRNHNPGLYQLSYSHHRGLAQNTPDVRCQDRLDRRGSPRREDWPARQDSNL